MAKLIIPRLDLQVRGIDAAVVRAALDRLPPLLAAALRQPAPPATGREPATVHVHSRIDAEALASTLATRIANVVRQRTSLVQRTGLVQRTNMPPQGTGVVRERTGEPSAMPVTSAPHSRIRD